MSGDKHVERRIEACLDGRLSVAEDAAVRAHCATCSECARVWAEQAAANAALAACPAPPPPRPAWPTLQVRWCSSARGGGRILVWSGVAAAVAGLMLGYLAGVSGVGTEALAGPQELASGTLWGDSQPTTLDGIYLVAGEDSP